MDLKSIFDKAEGGVLSYEQLMAAAKEGNAKFVDLSEGKYVDKQKYTDDLAERDTRITTLDDTIKNRDNDLADLRKQLETAGTDSDKLAKMTTDLADLQKRYDTDTANYKQQLKDQEYSHLVKEFADGQKFTSQAAKRDFVSSLMSKNLTVEEGKLIGASDFVSAYAEENADAFVVDTPPAEPTPPETKPHFAGPTQPGGGNDTSELIPFTFTGVRPHDK